jgi:hypothetical protein
MMLKAAQSLLFAVDLPISRLQRSQNSWAFTRALPWAITFRAFGAETRLSLRLGSDRVF